MPRAPEFRTNKYDAKIDGDVQKARIDTYKIHMVDQAAARFAELYEVERKAKNILNENGVSVIEIPMYLDFARECYRISRTHSSTTRLNEVYFHYLKWVNRGLTAALLADMATLCGTDISDY